MELLLIIHVPTSLENNCDDNQILISTFNYFYSHFSGGTIIYLTPCNFKKVELIALFF